MAHSYHSKPQIVARPGFYILISLLVLFLPLKWVLAWLVAAAVHETSHYIALSLLQCRIFSITVGVYGAVIDADTHSDLRECLCAAAGPLSGILLVGLGRFIPYIAVCALFQTAFNLLPITGFDGGRIVCFIISSVFPAKYTQRICETIELVSAVGILAVAIFLTFRLKVGTLPLIFAMVVFLRIKPLKSPCKHRRQIVQ